jgi:hypothetical protein
VRVCLKERQMNDYRAVRGKRRSLRKAVQFAESGTVRGKRRSLGKAVQFAESGAVRGKRRSSRKAAQFGESGAVNYVSSEIINLPAVDLLPIAFCVGNNKNAKLLFFDKDGLSICHQIGSGMSGALT